MAAVSDAQVPAVVSLRDLATGQLDPLLAEETAEWERSLDWDFTPSAGLVKRFIRLKALNGFGLLLGGRLIGYSYSVCEGQKGLVGDLYVLPRYRCPGYEDLLLKRVLEALFRSPGIERVEAQLMLLANSLERPMPHRRFLKSYPRQFMAIPAAAAGRLPEAPPRAPVRVMPWSGSDKERAARLIAAAYQGHIDAAINDQYRSLAGALRFLQNIVEYPGCGTFFRPGSFVAGMPGSPELLGLSLASLVAPRVGHITQICVAPAVRHSGLGYELLRRSLTGLAEHGCRRVSLTVSAANHEAVRLYERVGFTSVRRFAACVWEGFP